MKSVLCIFGLIFPLLMYAQPKEFTYISDRIFNKGGELYGHTFVPAEGKLSSAHYPVEIEKGMARFEITSTGMKISESVKFTPGGRREKPEENYSLSIPRINTTSYGYEIILMDYNDGDMQGHLQVHLNDKRQAEFLIFKPSPSEAERAYYLTDASKDIASRDGKFFTHMLDHPATSLDEFWDKPIYPFSKLTQISDYKEFKRIYPGDGVTIQLEERTELKGKKEKIVQYLVVNQKVNGEKKIDEYQIRKVMEEPKGAPTRLELEIRDKDQNKGSIMFHWTEQKTLSSIEMMGTKFMMRPGKRRAG